MAAPGADALRASLAALDEDLARALWRADAGLGPAADLPAVFARHPQATGPDAADRARELAAEEPVGDGPAGDSPVGGDGGRPLAAWAARLIGRRAGAEPEARARAWAAAALVGAPGGAAVPFREVNGALAAAAGDRAARLALDDARAALAGAEYASPLRERWARERDALEALGIAGGYLDAWARLEGVDPRAVSAAGAAFTRDTDGAWYDALAEASRRRLGAAPGDLPGGLRRADLPVLLADPALDALLPAGAALAAVRTQAAAMGLDPGAGGRVRYDVGARPGQRPGAWCAAVRVPAEVYVVARLRGGVGAWRGLLGAVGRALHAGYTSPDLPAERRAEGGAAWAAAAALWAALLADEGWLRRYADLDRERAGAVRRLAASTALGAARRDAAALRLTVGLLAGDVPAGEAADAGVALLLEATGARAPAADLALHAEPWLGPAARLRGALLAPVLAEVVRERFDEDWWRNPRCGPWLATAVFAGTDATPDADLGGPLDPAPAVRAAERALA